MDVKRRFAITRSKKLLNRKHLKSMKKIYLNYAYRGKINFYFVRQETVLGSMNSMDSKNNIFNASFVLRVFALFAKLKNMGKKTAKSLTN